MFELPSDEDWKEFSDSVLEVFPLFVVMDVGVISQKSNYCTYYIEHFSQK